MFLFMGFAGSWILLVISMVIIVLGLIALVNEEKYWLLSFIEVVTGFFLAESLALKEIFLIQHIVVIISLLAAILIGQDANRRGMSSWGWGIFVFIVLIIGLPTYFIVRKPIVENQ